MKKKSTCTLPLTTTNFAPTATFLRNELSARINPTLVEENMLVIEEMYQLLLEIIPEDTELTFSVARKLSGLTVSIFFRGDRFSANLEDAPDDDLSVSILREYRDKLSYSYHRGENTISILAARSGDSTTLTCLFMLPLVCILYGILRLFLGSEQLLLLNNNIIRPVETLFTRAVIMISSPVTFFSLVTNITDSFIRRHSYTNSRRLILGITLTSLLSLGVAFGISSLAYPLTEYILPFLKENFDKVIPSAQTVFDMIQAAIPSNIFEPFTTDMPFPAIVLALLSSFAICGMDRRFNSIKALNDTLNEFVLSALTVILKFLPLCAFCVFFDILVRGGYSVLLPLLYFALLGLVGLVFMLAVYSVMLLFNRISPFVFWKKTIPALREVLYIGSVISAVPAMSRFMIRTFHTDRKTTSGNLHLLAQTNLDGNCCLLLILSLFICRLANVSITPLLLFPLCFIIVALSVGAPNQSGSLLIGLTIISSFLGTDTKLLSMAVFCEILYSFLLLLINSCSDLTLSAIESKKTGKFKI